MATTRNAVAAIVRRVGFDPGRVAAVARELTDANIIPGGGPGKSPNLSPQHAATIIIAAALDAPLRAIAGAVVQYRGMKREGLPDGAPAMLQDTAGDYIDVLAEMAATGGLDERSTASHARISVVSNWPEIDVSDEIAVRRFREAGELPGFWGATGHRRAVEINGAAFVDVMRDLFCED
jgi:hypothetical protein